MRDPNRIPEVLERLALYWQKNPDLRLAQIVSNAKALEYPGSLNNDVFFMEDDALLRGLTKLEAIHEGDG